MGAGAGKTRRYATSEIVVFGNESLDRQNTSSRITATPSRETAEASPTARESPRPAGTSPNGSSPPLLDKVESLRTQRSMHKKRSGVKKVISIWKTDKELCEFKPHIDFLRAIASPTTGLHTYCHTIIEEVVKVLEADRCSLYFVDEIRKEVWCIGASDCEPFRLPWERGIVGLVARDGKTLNITDPHSHEAFEKAVEQKTGYMVQNMLTVPIRHMVDQSRAVGVLQCLNKQGETAFSAADERELEKFAMIISDSFYRQRWRALESSAKFENEASALLDTMKEVQQKSKAASASDGVAGPVTSPTSEFKWQDNDGDAILVSQEGEAPVHLEALLNISSMSGSSPDALRSLTFNTLAYEGEYLVRLVPQILDDAGLLSSGCVSQDKVREWVWTVERTYRRNPFHNWLHAFSVFQMCYAQLWHCRFSRLRFLDVFGILIAGLCHDLDHPGVTNSYLIDGEDELAMRYNDNSVLENHHASLACEILRKDETAIGSSMSKADQVALRRILIKSILDTDMMRHNELCQQTMARVSGADVDELDLSSPTDRQWLLSTVLHTSDLSAQLQKWPAAAAWEERISQEFVNQAELELAAGRQPAPFMQFTMGDLSQRGKLQRNFIDYVLVPLWDPYTQLQTALRPCFQRLLRNRERYDFRASNGKDSDEADDPGSP